VSQARPMLTTVVVRSGLASETHDETRVKSSCFHPTQPIVPRWKMTVKSEGLTNWNKSIKPNVHDFKPFQGNEHVDRVQGIFYDHARSTELYEDQLSTNGQHS